MSGDNQQSHYGNKSDPNASINMDALTGLSHTDVEERLDKYGYNEINEKEEGWFRRLFRRFWGPIPWMIEAAAILSALVQHWEDFIVIMLLLFVNAFVDFYQESKALNAISVLKKKLAHTATVLREGKWQDIDAKEIVPDDILKLKIGDVVPADVKLLGGGDFLLVDQSALTGESLPVQKKQGDEVYANAIIKQGEMIAQATATAKNTFFGKTVELVAKAEHAEVSHFQKMVIKVGYFLIALTLVMIAIIIYHGISTNQPTIELLVFALVLTISAIPVAMPAVLTVTMAIGAQSLAAKEAIVSRLAAIEELAGMDVLCSDKTGTLTQNKMSLSQPYTVKQYTMDTLMLYAAYASKKENQDPIEKPIFEYIDTHNLSDAFSKISLKKYVPFDPVSKKAEAVYDNNLVYAKGAPQIIIELCDETEFNVSEAYGHIDSFAQKGFRTLGVAYKHVDENTYHFVGLIPLFDPPREDSAEAIEQAMAKGVSVKLVTGDNISVAKYIADILHIGQDIENIKELKGQSTKEYIFLADILSRAILKNIKKEINEDQLNYEVQHIVSQVEKELDLKPLPEGSIKQHESEIVAIIEKANGFAQVFPEDKYFIVGELQKADHIVGMTGDGVNDAPALKKADCGIAVSGATEAARAAADIVLMAPGLTVIVDAIKASRQIFERMKSYTIFRIAETIRVIIFMTLAIVVYDFYPITALMIIILALLNDIPIMTIAYDRTKVRPDPVRWDMKEVFILASWLGFAGVVSSFMLFWVLISLLNLPLEFVQSMFFAKLVVAGHGTIYNTRIDDWFWKRPWPSWTLFSATFFSRVAGTVIAVYGFGLMVPIGWELAMWIWVYALVWLVFNDVVKMAILRYYRKRYNEDIL